MLDLETRPANQASAEPTGPNSPRLNGVVDVSRPGRVVGWAIDRADPEAAVDVEIYRDGRRVAKIRADRHREDLVRNGIGTGNYGFTAELDTPVEPGMAFAVTAVACAADGTRNTLRPIGKAAASSEPERRILERIFEEVIRLEGDVVRLRKALPTPGTETLDRVQEVLERIEVIQARLEKSTLDAGARDATGSETAGLKLIALTALVTAFGSLAVGIFSMWHG